MSVVTGGWPHREHTLNTKVTGGAPSCARLTGVHLHHLPGSGSALIHPFLNMNMQKICLFNTLASQWKLPLPLLPLLPRALDLEFEALGTCPRHATSQGKDLGEAMWSSLPSLRFLHLRRWRRHFLVYFDDPMRYGTCAQPFIWR